MATDEAISAWVATMLKTDEARRAGKTQKGLARALGLDQSQGNRIVQGKRRFKAAEIPLIEHYLGERLPAEIETAVKETPEAPDGYALVPVHDVRASAGFGAVAVEAEPLHHELMRLNELYSFARDISQLFFLEISGDSGKPTLYSGDRALCYRGDIDPRREGRFIIRIDDVLQVKMISAHPVTKRLTVRSENPDYPSYSDIDPNDIHIIARVVGVWRKLV